jgi:hypothetical protein
MTSSPTKLMIDPCCAIQNPKGAWPIEGAFASSQSRNKMPHPKLTKNQTTNRQRTIRKQARRWARGWSVFINTIFGFGSAGRSSIPKLKRIQSLGLRDASFPPRLAKIFLFPFEGCRGFHYSLCRSLSWIRAASDSMWGTSAPACLACRKGSPQIASNSTSRPST